MYCFSLVNGRLLVRSPGAGESESVPVSRDALRRDLTSGASGLLSNCRLLGRTLAVAFCTIVEKCISMTASVSGLNANGFRSRTAIA